MIEISKPGDTLSRVYDIINLLSIVINLICAVLYTFEEYRSAYGRILLLVEAITVAFFAMDYTLRLLTAKAMHPKLSE